MTRNNPGKSDIRKFSYGGLLLAMALVLTAVTVALSADDRQIEIIDATAMGTSTQLGKDVGVKVIIYEYSADEDRQILIDVFKKGPESRIGECAYQDEVRRPHGQVKTETFFGSLPFLRTRGKVADCAGNSRGTRFECVSLLRLTSSRSSHLSMCELLGISLVARFLNSPLVSSFNRHRGSVR